MMKMMGDKAGTLAGTSVQGMEIKTNDVFEYSDPVDGSVSKNQGIRFIFSDGSRIVFRVSGTGVVGATIRMYLEKFEDPAGNLDQHPMEVVKPLAELGLKLAELKEFTGREEPN